MGHHVTCLCLQDGEGAPVDVQVKDNGNGTYSCSYTPRKPVKHTAMISWGGVNIPNSPFRVGAAGRWPLASVLAPSIGSSL